MKTKGSNVWSKEIVSLISFCGILQLKGMGVLLLLAIMKTLASVC